MSARPLAALQQDRPGDHARWVLIAVLALFAWLLLREGLVPLQMLGGLIVLAGIYLARRGSS